MTWTRRVNPHSSIPNREQTQIHSVTRIAISEDFWHFHKPMLLVTQEETTHGSENYLFWEGKVSPLEHPIQLLSTIQYYQSIKHILLSQWPTYGKHLSTPETKI